MRPCWLFSCRAQPQIAPYLHSKRCLRITQPTRAHEKGRWHPGYRTSNGHRPDHAEALACHTNLDGRIKPNEKPHFLTGCVVKSQSLIQRTPSTVKHFRSSTSR